MSLSLCIYGPRISKANIGCSACIESSLVAYLQFVDLAETDFLFSSIFLV